MISSSVSSAIPAGYGGSHFGTAALKRPETPRRPTPEPKKSSTTTISTTGTKQHSIASGPGSSRRASNFFTSKRRQSCFNRSSIVAGGDISSPVLQVSTGTLQYNGPHSIDMEDDMLEITHGMHKDYTIKIAGHVKTVLYYPKIKSCTVLHSGGICRYNSNEFGGEFHDTGITSNIDKLLHSAELGVYVGVCKHGMKLLNRSFQLLCEVESPGRITASVFNQHSGEVVTASPGRIVVCQKAALLQIVLVGLLVWVPAILSIERARDSPLSVVSHTDPPKIRHVRVPLLEVMCVQ